MSRALNEMQSTAPTAMPATAPDERLWCEVRGIAVEIGAMVDDFDSLSELVVDFELVGGTDTITGIVELLLGASEVVVTV
jgi:hypothetical protein